MIWSWRSLGTIYKAESGTRSHGLLNLTIVSDFLDFLSLAACRPDPCHSDLQDVFKWRPYCYERNAEDSGSAGPFERTERWSKTSETLSTRSGFNSSFQLLSSHQFQYSYQPPESMNFNPRNLSEFGFMCYLGILEDVKKVQQAFHFYVVSCTH